MWGAYTHISSYYMAANIFSLGDGVKFYELLLKKHVFLLMQGWWRMWKRRPTSSW